MRLCDYFWAFYLELNNFHLFWQKGNAHLHVTMTSCCDIILVVMFWQTAKLAENCNPLLPDEVANCRFSKRTQRVALKSACTRNVYKWLRRSNGYLTPSISLLSSQRFTKLCTITLPDDRASSNARKLSLNLAAKFSAIESTASLEMSPSCDMINRNSADKANNERVTLSRAHTSPRSLITQNCYCWTNAG